MATEAAADSATAMSTEPSTELVDSQAARIKELEAKLASETAKSSVFEDQARTKISGFQDSAKWFLKEFLPEGESAEVKSEIASMGCWADEYTQKKNVLDQLPLARSCEVASGKFKRLRDEAAAGAKASETLVKTFKELEELKEADAKKAQRIVELETGMMEKQQAAEKLQAELSKAGLVASKFDFSKLMSREKVEDPPAEPHAAMVTDAPMQAVTANASRGTASEARARSSGNPFDSDPLTAMIMSRGQGGSRVNASSTGHAWVGMTDATGDLAAILARGQA